MKNWSFIIAGIIILAIGSISFQVSDLTGGYGLGDTEKYSTTYGQFYPDEIDLSVDHASCTWKKDHYETCAQVSWKGLSGYYLKSFIASGSVKDSEKIKQNPYVYCSDVGDNAGQRAVHAYLYTSSNVLKRADVNTFVNCDKSEEPLTKTVKQRYSIIVDTSDRTRNTGSKTFNGLEGKPVSCEVTGTWKTKNRRTPGASISFCHGATGSFTGYFQEGKQYVINDMDLFDYTDQGTSKGNVQNPPPTTHNGYTLYTRICDQTQFEQGRSYARAKVVSFNPDGFTLDWEYNNPGTRPSVEFLFEVTCKVETGEVKGKKDPIIQTPKPIIPVLEPVFPEEPVEPVIEQKRPLIFKLVDWVKSLF
ncbi:MAG: hypothetical protein Q8R00_04300 [Candidatus Nanoarchaeia archaeon]|nr:hypothetical protein [Candidatus Nanoarchaeia archaeon]